MKRIFILFVLLLSAYPLSVWAACTGSSPTWIADADSTSVNSCISQASEGDTLNVRAGTFSWTPTLTKHISIIGGYDGTTTITGGVTVNPSITGTDILLRFSNFTVSCGRSPCVEWGTGNSTPGFAIMKNVRFDHNILTNISAYGWHDWYSIYGTVDHNSFGTSTSDRCGSYCMWNEANCYGETSAHNYWDASPQNIFALGSINFTYYEDNVFYPTTRAAIHQWCARGVYRYNTIYESGNAEFEIHGHQGSGTTALPATFGFEIYGNNLIGNTSTFANIRSGENLIFNNNLTNGNPSIQTYCDSATSCANDVPAMQMTHDNYYWSNRKNLTGVTESVSSNGYTCSYSCGGNSSPIPLAGRDYFNANTTPTVGCGTLANIPATCTIDQGYWATNQSCTDLTGMVGVSPSTTISGTLYKCTATNTWTAYYTPYIYPHPLTTGGGILTIKPNAPSYLRLLN